jgi:hypothetical protein
MPNSLIIFESVMGEGSWRKRVDHRKSGGFQGESSVPFEGDWLIAAAQQEISRHGTKKWGVIVTGNVLLNRRSFPL